MGSAPSASQKVPRVLVKSARRSKSTFWIRPSSRMASLPVESASPRASMIRRSMDSVTSRLRRSKAACTVSGEFWPIRRMRSYSLKGCFTDIGISLAVRVSNWPPPMIFDSAL